MSVGTHTDVTQRGPPLASLTHTARMVRKMSGECDDCFLTVLLARMVVVVVLVEWWRGGCLVVSR